MKRIKFFSCCWKATPARAFNEFLYEILRILLISENSLKFENFFCWGNEFSIYVSCYSERGTAETRSSEQYFRDRCGFTGRRQQDEYSFMYQQFPRAVVLRRSWYSDGCQSSLCYQRCSPCFRLAMWNILRLLLPENPPLIPSHDIARKCKDRLMVLWFIIIIILNSELV